MEVSNIILARNPYMVALTDSKVEFDESSLKLYIWRRKKSDKPSVAQFEFTKEKLGSGFIWFNIQNYIKDSLDPTIGSFIGDFGNLNNSNSTDTCWVYYQISLDYKGVQQASFKSEVMLGVYGYDYFKAGANPKLNSNILTQGRSFDIPQNGIFKTAVFNFDDNPDINNYDTVRYYKNYPDVQVNEVCEMKYVPFQVAFINRYGFFQTLSFAKASTKKLSSNRSNYRRILFENGGYNTLKHQVKDYDLTAKETISLNTDIIKNESDNEIIRQFILSDQHYLIENKVAYPVRIITPNIEFKTLVKNRIIQYSFDFEFTNNIINDIT